MVEIVYEGHPQEPGLDTGISHALVKAVGEGRRPETFRIHPTGRIVAFGRQDRVVPGYAEAVAAARTAGYLPLERLAGGRAAVFHEDTLAFSWAIPTAEPREGITARFRMISGLLADAFGDLGFDARVGALPGEYCPGAYSVNVGGIAKVMGVGQRLVRGAAHVGGVIVVDGGRRISDVLLPVYDALGLTWEPLTSGDLRDFQAGVSTEAVIDAVIDRLRTLTPTVPATLPNWLVEEGRQLAVTHLSPAA